VQNKSLRIKVKITKRNTQFQYTIYYYKRVPQCIITRECTPVIIDLGLDYLKILHRCLLWFVLIEGYLIITRVISIYPLDGPTTKHDYKLGWGYFWALEVNIYDNTIHDSQGNHNYIIILFIKFNRLTLKTRNSGLKTWLNEVFI
jgi:hypothetical protein